VSERIKYLKKMGFMKKTGRSLRRYFIEGLVFVIPIIVLIWVLYYLFRWFYGVFHFSLFFLPREIRLLPFVKLLVVITSFVIVLILIFFLGLIINTFFGKTIKGFFDKIFSLIPIFGSFYDSLKHISAIVFKGTPSQFTGVVLVEFPRIGSWCIGFITSKVENEGITKILGEDKEYYIVFIPTSPNPTTGFTVIVEKEKVKNIDISVEEALKLVVFLGFISGKEEDQ